MSNADKRTAIALFRYTLILPLLRGQYPPGGKQQLVALVSGPDAARTARARRALAQRLAASPLVREVHAGIERPAGLGRKIEIRN